MFPFNRRHNAFPQVVGTSILIFTSLLLVGCGGGSNSPAPDSVAAIGTPGAEGSVGERLFVESRFAQFFNVYLDSEEKVNDVLPGAIWS